tara:strand:+ start:1067 stop:2020 length:954 start_codon:yes stop_codon:yes gene_type:complete
MSTNPAEKLDDLPQENEVETVDTGEFEIDIVDDTPEQDRNRSKKEAEKEPEVSEDDEISNYGENVQKRIKQIKYEYHEERRAKEEAQRVREEAIAYAQKVQEENKKLRKTLEDGESTLVEQAKGRVEAQINTAKAAYKEAYETGDPDKLIEAQEKLTALQNEKFKVESYKPAKREQETPVPQAQPVQQPKYEVDDRTKQWAAQNEWFGKDEEMTGFAFGVHEKLKKNGIDPANPQRVEEYYSAVDEAMRKRFPDKFDEVEIEEAPPRQTGNVVAPANRSAKKPRRVQLTSTQVSLAKRLGLTPEQYAAQLMKEASNV